MRYEITLNEEERNLLLIDLQEMIGQEEFYDKDLARRTFYKIIYAKIRSEEDGKHFTEGEQEWN